jgi:hypothetical protein
MNESIDRFFENYVLLFNNSLKGKPDVDGTASSFSDCFIEATPGGVNCGKNDVNFRKVIPQGYDFYKSIGLTSMQIVSKTITVLDQFHAMVKVNWRSEYAKEGAGSISIDFDVIYFIQNLQNGVKIFAFIAGDENAALKKSGLI